MPSYAVLNGNTVENLIMAETLEIAQAVTKTTCVEYVTPPYVGIGYIYNPTTNTFSAPVTESQTNTVK